MRATELVIHNFRSICDASIAVSPYGMLVGVNNAGKSTVIDAVRVFYGAGIKYSQERDFPRKGAKDDESWIEIEFEPSANEFDSLKDEYKTDNKTFRVRNYLLSNEKDAEGKTKSGPYAYINGVLSNDRFYGFKNVGQSKFGQLVYIPAVSKSDEQTKLTGPSPLRDLLNSVLSRIMEGSNAYQDLRNAFDEFEGKIKGETTEDGQSIESIEADISKDIEEWGANFRLKVNPVGADDLVKGLIGHEIYDHALGEAHPLSSYGQGFQRNVIYTLIRVAAQYTKKPPSSKKREFSPELTWILFEEPEAFLHPTQVSVLSSDLKKLVESDDTQVTLSTHSPQFASHSIRSLPAICRLQRDESVSQAYQVTQDDLDKIGIDNQAEANKWVADGIAVDPDDLSTDMEAVKYALWLDSRRAGAFFSERVLLVEGPTETALFAYMYDQGFLPNCRGVFILDTIGKYNIHRFMKIFEKFGIRHYVLYDYDNGKHPPIDAAIQNATNQFTRGVDKFPKDLEEFLGITPAKKPHRKPQHVMLQVASGAVDLTELSQKLNTLISG